MSEDEGHDHSAVATALAPEKLPPENMLTMDADELLAQQGVSLTEKIRFVWREEDQSILDRIEIAATAMFANMFSEAIDEMNLFYARLRVPRINPDTGIVLDDGHGNYLYQTDSRGRYIERWDQLVGSEVEQAIMNLARIKLVVAPEVNKLKSKAVYAKMVAEDLKDDVWKKVAQGTVGDKTSKANRESRQDRYHAFFSYHLWTVADTFLRELIDFMYRLKDVRMWRIQDQQR